jgi:GYF domain 2/Interferon-induced transmembrane protein
MIKVTKHNFGIGSDKKLFNQPNYDGIIRKYYSFKITLHIMKQYYYNLNGQQVGPISLSELMASPIFPNTKIWYEGLGDWQDASTISELQSMFPEASNIYTSNPPANPVSAPIQSASNPASYPNYQQQQNANYLDGQQNIPPVFYLVGNIIVTVIGACSCIGLITGIIGIIYSSNAQKKFKMGDLLGSQADAKIAKILFYVTLGLIILNTLVGIGMVMSGNYNDFSRIDFDD